MDYAINKDFEFPTCGQCEHKVTRMDLHLQTHRDCPTCQTSTVKIKDFKGRYICPQCSKIEIK